MGFSLFWVLFKTDVCKFCLDVLEDYFVLMGCVLI